MLEQQVGIEKISAKNIKAVSEFIAVFNGKCAHITGKNGKGKSTIIRVLIDKLCGLPPHVATKIGEKEGKYELQLTDGGRFVWEFNDNGREKIDYYQPESLRPVSRVKFKEIVKRYFTTQFDMNKFLTTSEPRKRLDMISSLINIDLSAIRKRYDEVFAERAKQKKTLKDLLAQKIPTPTTFNFSNIASMCDDEQQAVQAAKTKLYTHRESIENERKRLNELYLVNKKANDEALSLSDDAYQIEIDKFNEDERLKQKAIEDHNDEMQQLADNIQYANDLLADLKLKLNEIDASFPSAMLTGEDSALLEAYIDTMPKPLAKQTFKSSDLPKRPKIELPDPMPENSSLIILVATEKTLESEVQLAEKLLKDKESKKNELIADKAVYDIQIENYRKYQRQIKEQSEIVDVCEGKVASILNEIKKVVLSAKLPDSFQLDLTHKNDILFRTSHDAEYLPITYETLASSAIYIAAFELQMHYIDVFRVVHFDVSYLDYENRIKVLTEAINMNIQLITESPASHADDSELKVTIMEGNSDE